MALLGHAWNKLRQDGLKTTWDYSQHWCSERFHDWRHGLSTRQWVELAPFGYDENYHQHDAAPYRDLKRIFRALPFDPGADEVLVDYGSGAGRVVLMAAATLPFKSIIGVELLPSLIALAEENRQRCKSPLICEDITFVESDAMAYALPPEATKAFFFNPFAGPVLETVLDNLHRQFLAAPRPLTIVFLNPGRARPIIEQRSWMRPTRTLTDLRYPCQFYEADTG
ncbi:MAG: class I SAM-dependent methyltransferase [Pseudomonadota bacterium]